MSSTPPERCKKLAEQFAKDVSGKQFEWAAKHYYDLFAYHATQRLTAFNFFIVSLSFISTAYATLLMRGAETPPKYGVAAVLALIAYLFVIAFGRLDKRNEQIITANEHPLIRIQEVFQHAFGGPADSSRVWETFKETDKTFWFRSFGDLLPTIYIIASLLTALGTSFGAREAGWFGTARPDCWTAVSALALWAFAVLAILCKGIRKKAKWR